MVYVRRLGFIGKLGAVDEVFFGDEGLFGLLREFDCNIRLSLAKTIYQAVCIILSYMFGGGLEITGGCEVDSSYMYNTLDPLSDHSGDMDYILHGDDSDIDSGYSLDV